MKKNTHKAHKRTLRDAMASAARLVGAPETDRVLTPEEEQVLKAAEAELARLDRDTTAQTFERGALFAQAKAILPKRFSKWLKAHTTYSVRHAWNHINVFEKLDWHRKRCEAASVPPSTLFILATADDERVINDVLCAFERGERITGARVKDMIARSRNEPVREVEPLNVGGSKGMIRLGEMRLRTEVDRFNGLVKGALHHVEAAAEKIANGKTVTKSGLSDAIKIDCRHAHDVLSMTIAPIVSNSFAENQNWTRDQWRRTPPGVR